MRLTLQMAVRSISPLLLLASLVVATSAASCAKRAEQAPAETAASQAAPAPAGAPQAPETPAAPAATAEPSTAGPSSFGEAAQQPKAGLTQPDQAPSTLPEAEKAFRQSEQQLDQLIGPLEAEKTKGTPAPAPLASGDARCPRACKAFESLRRAGEAICRLAGTADARCTHAKEVVKQNQSRVTVCACENSKSNH